MGPGWCRQDVHLLEGKGALVMWGYLTKLAWHGMAPTVHMF